MVRYLNPSDHHPARIPKADKDFAVKSLVKIRNIHKIRKKNSMGISVFGYENREKYPIYVSKKCCEEKHTDKRRREKWL